MAQEFDTSITVSGKKEEVVSFYDYFVGKLMAYYKMPHTQFLELNRDDQIYFRSPDILNIGENFDFRKRFFISDDNSMATIEFEEFETIKRTFPLTWFTTSGLKLDNIIIDLSIYEDCIGSWKVRIWNNEIIKDEFESVTVGFIPDSLRRFL